MSLEKSPKFVLNMSRSDLKDGKRRFYEFRSFRLDVAERRLLHNNSPLALTPKAFDVLALLVERSGRLVGRDELLENIWSDSFVEEQNITRTIHTLRRTLGEKDSSEKYIETVARKGYRFVADVTEVCGAEKEQHGNGNGNSIGNGNGHDNGHGLARLIDHEVDVPDGSLDAAPERKRSVRPILLTAGLVTAVFLLVLFAFDLRSDPGAGANRVTSIAVLPLRPVDAVHRDEIYEMGIAESVINALGPMNGLIVRPLSATRHYSDITQDALAAGTEQKVDYVLGSSYQLAQGRIRITSQLFNVATGQIDETFKSEPDVTDLFAMQDAVAAEIASKLAARFGTSMRPAVKRGTSNEEAYRNYLQGMRLYDLRNKKAIESFDRAVELDPDYAHGWAGRSLGYLLLDTFPEPGEYERYRHLISGTIARALELDPALAVTHSSLCTYKADYEHDFMGAEAACRRAIELEPNSSLAHLTYADFLIARGRHDESISSIKTAIDLDPSSFFCQRLYANILYWARRHDEARSQYRRLWELDPGRKPTYEHMIRNLDAAGRYDEAFEWFVRSLSLYEPDPNAADRYKGIFEKEGWFGVLRERERTDLQGLNVFRRAGVNAQIGNNDRAFELLEQSFKERSTSLRTLHLDFQFDRLRSDPRYAEFEAKIGVK